MKREILNHKRNVSDYHSEVCQNRLLRHARSKMKRHEHHRARLLGKNAVREEMADLHAAKVEADEAARKEWEELLESMAQDGEDYLAFCSRLMAEEEQEREDLSMHDWEEEYYTLSGDHGYNEYGYNEWYEE